MSNQRQAKAELVNDDPMPNPSTDSTESSSLEVSVLENIQKEFVILDDSTGAVGVTRRGVARLSGVSHVAIVKLLNSIKGGNQTRSKIFKTFAGQDFEGGNHIPDVLASAVIKYYAYQGKETAQDVDAFLGALGLRSFAQQSLGWSKLPSYTKPLASEWQVRFEKPFYDELSRLTGLKAQGHKRPQLWGKLTKELFYDWLPHNIYESLKKYQASGDKNAKLHQYLGDDGLKIFNAHRDSLFCLMQASQDVNQLMGLIATNRLGQYQHVLVEGKPKVDVNRVVSQLQMIQSHLLWTVQDSLLTEQGTRQVVDSLQTAISMMRN